MACTCIVLHVVSVVVHLTFNADLWNWPLPCMIELQTAHFISFTSAAPRAAVCTMALTCVLLRCLLVCQCLLGVCCVGSSADVVVPSAIQKQVDLVQRLVPQDARRHLEWHGTSSIVSALMRPRRKHFLDAFCGTGRLTVALMERGFSGYSYDLESSSSQNILSGVGFAMLLTWLLDVMSGGFFWCGIVCSTWVFMSRGHTLRNRANPHGNTSRSDVAMANIMADRVAFLCELCSLRGVLWVAEQPSSSILFHYVAFKPMLPRVSIRRHRVRRKFIWLGFRGHRLYKPTVLIGIAPWMMHLRKVKRRTATIPLHYKLGSIRKTGPRKGTYRMFGITSKDANLKKTQVDPARFWTDFADLHKALYDALDKRL